MATFNATLLEIRLNQTLAELSDLRKNVDDIFLITNGIIVSLMQTGFACLEAGCVRSKNVTNILMKNILDLFVAALVYWLFGYSLAYSQGNSVVGLSNWAGMDLPEENNAHWFFQFIFAATAATIISGAVAERCQYISYIIYCATLSGFIYPIASHWVWAEGGFLATMGYMDFAGSGVVHALAGVASFCAAYFIGPRRGRFVNGKNQEIPGHSTMLTGLGGLLLVSGFFSFNGASLGHMTQHGDSAMIARTISNSVLAGSGAGILALVLTRTGIVGRPTWAFGFTLNGILAGIVSVCAFANTFTPLGAILSGFFGCFFFWIVRNIVTLLKVDDPLDAVAVHFGGGFWGVIAGPIFAKNGIIYGITTASIKQLRSNFFGVIIICLWSAVTSTILFGGLRIVGLLRVSEEKELKGLDLTEHGEPAYPSSAYQIDGNNDCYKVQQIPNESLEKANGSKNSYRLNPVFTGDGY